MEPTQARIDYLEEELSLLKKLSTLTETIEALATSDSINQIKKVLDKREDIINQICDNRKKNKQLQTIQKTSSPPLLLSTIPYTQSLMCNIQGILEKIKLTSRKIQSTLTHKQDAISCELLQFVKLRNFLKNPATDKSSPPRYLSTCV